MKKLVLTVALFTMIWGSCVASGYQVLLQGNRTTGMGNLGVALRSDASSLFFNPGAMGLLDHNSIQVGFNPIFANNFYWDSETTNSTYTASSDNPMGTPFSFYAVWGPENSKFKFGLGAFTPFGSSVNWGNTWNGRDLLNEISLKAIQIQPTLSYKLNDRLAIGAGLDVTIGSVQLSRTILIDGQDGEGSVTLDGSATMAFGYNFGLFYALSEKLDLGISYRSRVDMEVEGGSAEFVVPSALAPFFPEGNTFSATLPLPSVTSVGLTYKLNDAFQIGTQFDWVGWGAYESLDIDFETNTSLLSDTESLRNYDDSWVWHLGGEYMVAEGVHLRAGFYYDKTPVQDGYMTAETPDNNRLGFTGGLGYSFGDLQLDLSFLYIHTGEREQTEEMAINAGTYNPDPVDGSRDVMPGTYRLNAFIPGFSIAYKF
ncbi:MAG: outer membrane protein transport protein [Cyclobacteriaceae bacterium]|nr:outer membrane protein transport protein [Cyclobacteriaceae bacterium]